MNGVYISEKIDYTTALAILSNDSRPPNPTELSNANKLKLHLHRNM